MAVTYAQFIVEYPEFSEVAQTLVEPRLTAWDSTLNGFGSDLHDRAVYVRTALDLSETVWGLPMAPQEGPNKYEKAWDRMLHMSYRRGQISGGGLT